MKEFRRTIIRNQTITQSGRENILQATDGVQTITINRYNNGALADIFPDNLNQRGRPEPERFFIFRHNGTPYLGRMTKDGMWCVNRNPPVTYSELIKLFGGSIMKWEYLDMVVAKSIEEKFMNGDCEDADITK